MIEFFKTLSSTYNDELDYFPSIICENDLLELDEVYIKNLSATNHIIAVWDSNKCEFDLSIDLKQTNEQNIGSVKCLN